MASSIRPVEHQTAPWVAVPENEVMSIEHPCIIKNRSKAIDMLGGAQQLAQNLEHGTQHSLGLTFTPNDPASRTVLSFHNETNNVLLKVTVPKRTGRKRKRGSNGAFFEEDAGTESRQDASHLLISLQQNRDTSSVEAVGNINSSHVWRNIPDFAYFTKTSNFLHGIETRLLSQQYPLIKHWSMPRTYGLEDTEIIPPPVWSTQSLSHNYTYRQNPAVKTIADPTTGSRVLFNKAAPIRLHIQIMMHDDVHYPESPSPDCPPLEDQSEQVQELVRQLQGLLAKRPIFTRRALINSLPLNAQVQLVRVAAAYVCYSLRSGPWRDAYVRFGVDPRTDPQYRKYQTILLKLMPKERAYLQGRSELQRMWLRSPDPKSHIFTGKEAVGVDGKTWQLCDLEDPELKGLVEIPELYLRPACETRYFGWYANGTSAKMRVLLKAKIDALADGTRVDPTMVKLFLQLPESWTPKVSPNTSLGPHTGYLHEGSTATTLEWASAYRSICRTAGGNLPRYGGSGKGRTSKPKPVTRPSYIDPELENTAEEEEDADDDKEEADVDAEVAAAYEEPDEGDEDLAVIDEDDANAS